VIKLSNTIELFTSSIRVLRMLICVVRMLSGIVQDMRDPERKVMKRYTYFYVKNLWEYNKLLFSRIYLRSYFL